jgi:hypothetical protein
MYTLGDFFTNSSGHPVLCRLEVLTSPGPFLREFTREKSSPKDFQFADLIKIWTVFITDFPVSAEMKLLDGTDSTKIL